MRLMLLFFTCILLARAADFSFYAYGISPAAVAKDGAGNLYLAGSTQSNVFPATAGSVQPSYSAGEMCLFQGPPVPQTPYPCQDVFVIKLDPYGAIVYATYLGGSGDDQALAIAADAQGNAYVAGVTSANMSGTDTFPITPGAAFPKPDLPAQSGFVAKISPAGDKLIYSTYLPFSSLILGMALDDQGDAFLTTDVAASDKFKATTGAFQTTPHQSGGAGAVLKLSADGATVLYATYLSGSTPVGGQSVGNSIAVDHSGNAYVTGNSTASDFPVTPGAYRAAQPQGGAFVAKLNASGSDLIYSTYLGGSGDSGTVVRVDSEGNAYVLGTAGTPDIPVPPGAFQPSPSVPWAQGSTSTFLVKLNSNASALLYATYLSNAAAMDVDAAGNAYVLGQASSGFPVTAGAFQRCFNGGGQDVYAVELSPGGGLLGATYFGGSGIDTPVGVAVLKSGEIAAAGTTDSADLPGVVTAAPRQSLLFVDSLVINDSRKADGPCMSLALENAASFQAGPVAPGEIVAIYGSGIGPDAPAYQQPGADGRVGTELAGVRVYFDDTAAPLLYVQSNQVNAIVPWAMNIHALLSGIPYAQVHVEYNGVSTNALTAPVVAAAPGIFIVDYASRQAAVLNEDGTLNSPTNPAAPGSVVSIYGTGGDFLQAGATDGAFWPLDPLIHFSSPAVVTIGGVGAQVIYAGSAPTLVSGVFQVNALVPSGLSPGLQPVALQIDGATAVAQITVR